MLDQHFHQVRAFELGRCMKGWARAPAFPGIGPGVQERAHDRFGSDSGTGRALWERSGSAPTLGGYAILESSPDGETFFPVGAMEAELGGCLPAKRAHSGSDFSPTGSRRWRAISSAAELRRSSFSKGNRMLTETQFTVLRHAVNLARTGAYRRIAALRAALAGAGHASDDIEAALRFWASHAART